VVSAAALDRLLAALVIAQVVTGLVTLRSGSEPSAWLFAVHGMLAGALAVAIGLKLWRAVPHAIAARRWGPLALSTLLGIAAGVALTGGYLWVVLGRVVWVGPWTLLTIHVLAALVLVPIAIAHLLPRRWRVLRIPARPRRSPADGVDVRPAQREVGPALSRRTVLITGAMAGVGVVGWMGANLVETLVGGARRFTGSRFLPEGGIPPPTTFYGEPVPAIDAAGWQLRVHGRVDRELALTADALRALGDVEREAILDCTSGWALRTTWRGTPLAAVLDAAELPPHARAVVVRSATGWATMLPLDEARGALLATQVAGQPLPTGNGAPCRLVVPDRRGLDWVKWVVEVEVA